MKLSTRIGIGVGLGLAVLAAVPFLMPLDVHRGPLERAATAALGREVHIKGPLSLTVYPQIGLSLADVTIANTPGSRGPNMVSIGSVLVGAKLMPLLERRLEVTEIVLTKPVIRMEVNAKGERNWGAATPSERRPNTTPLPTGFQFNTVSIDGGELSYFDAGTNKTELFKEIGVRMVLMRTANTQGLNAPLNIAGRVTYNNEELKIDAKINRLAAMLNHQPTPLNVGIASAIVNANFSGSLGGDGRLSGALKMGARSVRSFAAWTGHPMPPGNGFGLVAIDGQFAAADGVYSLTHAQVAFDSMTLSTDISIDTNGTIPTIKGLVTANRLDINPYLAPGREPDAVKAARAKAAAPSDTPLEFGWLKAANADLKLVLGGLITPHWKLDQAIVIATLQDGVLKADLSSVTAYGGTGKGSFSIDASGPVPAVREALEVNGFKAQPLLTDMTGFNRISGTGTLKVELSSKGATEQALIKGLNGRGSLRVTSGAVTGIDLTAVARVMQSVLTAEVLTGTIGNDAKTEFGQLGGNFVVKDGVLATNDLALSNASIELTGKGTTDLSAQTVDFRFEPKAKKGIPGLKLVDIGVPFYVRGPWEKPHYGPDAKALPKAIAAKLGENAAIPGELIRNPGQALRALLGGGS